MQLSIEKFIDQPHDKLLSSHGAQDIAKVMGY
jgi:hypothetical protein